MKTLRKMLKLLPPAFVMRRWLDRRYGIKVPPAPGGAIAGSVLAILPYAFTAALGVRVGSDRRILKYLLPYGRMKRFVKFAYGMDVGNAALDKGFSGIFRALMPYGLVLWWDAETERLSPGRRRIPDRIAQRKTVPDVVCRMTDQERQELARLDKIEALVLRMAIVSGGIKEDVHA